MLYNKIHSDYNSIILHVHIPKSGGTFIKHYLLSNIEADYENNQNQQDYDDKYRTTCERAINGILWEVPDYKNYFIDILKRTEKMSTCASTQVGSVIVRDGRIISTGWNGVPAGKKHCNEIYEWGALPVIADSHQEWSPLNELHAEVNAIGYAAQNGVVTKDAVLYTSVSPCIDCAKLIVAAGIKEVWYIDEYRITEGIKFLNENKIGCKKL